MNTSMTLSVDGKEIRSTEKMDIYEEPIHIVSAHISELKMTVAQETVAGISQVKIDFRDIFKRDLAFPDIYSYNYDYAESAYTITTV